MNNNVLLYFVKYPAPGEVKTRLAKTVGFEEAARMYRELAGDNFKMMTPLYQRKICDLVVAFDPPDKERDFKKWFVLPCEYWAQQGNGLGERLTSAFHEAFQRQAKRVIAVGSDTLNLTADILEEAFEKLATEDVVIGPARDGGYYLIGLSRQRAQLFQNIPWSTVHVLESTLTIIRKENLNFSFLHELEDLDEMAKETV